MSDSFKIEGKSVTLRTTSANDLKDYKRWNNPDLKFRKFDAPWFDDDLTGITRHRELWLHSENVKPFTHLEIETKEEVHIGWVVVYYNKRDPHMTEIGIDIPEDSYWGKGLGTEALTLWIDYLFKEYNLTRLGFSTWDGNSAVKVIGEKLGFTEESRIRNGCMVNGKFYDRIKMGILREEWQIGKNK